MRIRLRAGRSLVLIFHNGIRLGNIVASPIDINHHGCNFIECQIPIFSGCQKAGHHQQQEDHRPTRNWGRVKNGPPPFNKLELESMSLKTSLNIVHLIGLAIGVGGATLLDLIIMRFMVLGRISQEHMKVVHLGHRFVTAGLALLWITGGGFLYYYYNYTPESLANPKIHAKIAIVLMLTLNGIFIQKYVLPMIAEKKGRQLFDRVSAKRKAFMLTCGSISAVSWYFPIVLGATKEWNFAMPASTLLLAYLALLSVTILGAQALARFLLDGPTSPQAAREAI